MSRTFLSLIAVFLIANPCFGAIVIFSGGDAGAASGDSHPNSDASLNSFLAAVGGNAGAITFEGIAATNPVTNVSVATGVSLTVTGNLSSGGAPGISTAAGTKETGYNTTIGGSTILRFRPTGFSGPDVVAMFTFTTPIEAFGMFLTGAEAGVPGPLSLEFNDGAAQILSIPELPAQGGGVQFYGFVDSGKSITTVTIREAGPYGVTGDLIGVDDVRFAETVSSSVPEPGSIVLFGSLAVAGMRSLQKRRQVRRDSCG